MIQFDDRKIMKPNTVVHCSTQEMRENLFKWANSKGFRTYWNKLFVVDTVWKGNEYINVFLGNYDNLETCIKYNYTILRYKDAVKSDHIEWYKNRFKDIKTVIFTEKITVVVLKSGVGVAECRHGDTYNQEIGILHAYLKAKGL